MSKTILLCSAMFLLFTYEANAQVSMRAIISEPGTIYYYPMPYRGYVLAPDYPSEHYDYHRHRHNDYWAHRDQDMREHEHREHEVHANYGHR